MKVFKYKNKIYPEYIKKGNAVENIIPIATKFCKGNGLDIGGTLEWHFPGATVVNPICNAYDAFNLPSGKFDYIFSSHCLEHIPNYVGALEIWKNNLKKGGQIFLYLPHPEMEYWLPQNCRKHIHKFEPETIRKVLEDLGFKDIFVSGMDLYWSFSATGRK